MRAVCVFCGSSKGENQYWAPAEQLGAELARRGTTLVYGGGKIGQMGLIADSALKQGGKVIGVIPQFLIDWEVAHSGLSELIVVESMHERKAAMAERSDAFIAMPGGFGTLEEFFEVLTWLQLGLHTKPCIVLNVNDFYSPLLDFLRSAHAAGFISNESMALVTVCDTISDLLSLLEKAGPSSGFQEELT